jgi:hypothetical protein
VLAGGVQSFVSAGVSALVGPEGSLGQTITYLAGWVLALALVAVATSALCEPGVHCGVEQAMDEIGGEVE